MIFNTGGRGNCKFEVVNRQGHVEYNILEGWATEEQIRSRVGNEQRSMYAHRYDGHYFRRKQAITRMDEELIDLKKQVEYLEFAIKVTKKKDWAKLDEK